MLPYSKKKRIFWTILDKNSDPSGYQGATVDIY